MSRRLWFAAISALLLSVPPACAQGADELDEFGGLIGVRRAATGFFRTTRAQGRWWLVDPNGFLFLSVGVNGVSLGSDSKAGDTRASYRGSCLVKHDSEAAWAKATVERLRTWGFNTLGAGSDAVARGQRMPYAVALRCAGVDAEGKRRRFPDVFDPAYERAVRRHASHVCRPLASDRWLLGYFTDLDLPWEPTDSRPETLLAQFLGLSDEAGGRRVLLRFLEDRYLNISELNRAWGTDYGSFEEVGRSPQVGSRVPQNDLDAFQREVAREYFRIAHDAIRAVDKYHLILGPRFCQQVPRPVLEAMADYVNVVSLSFRGTAPPAEHLRQIHRVAGWPVILADLGSQWRDDRGSDRTAAGTTPVAREDVGQLYQAFVEDLLALPMVVGYHWCGYVDEASGDASRLAGARIGLVDIRDEPCAEFVRAVAEVNSGIYRLAAGTAAHPSGAAAGDR